ncbi:MAG: hypothetical protein SH847_17085, partial [Roseiflexaceae bacterium]|nr:hypothetical protein [Roseiflexaceae bacterium]
MPLRVAGSKEPFFVHSCRYARPAVMLLSYAAMRGQQSCCFLNAAMRGQQSCYFLMPLCAASSHATFLCRYVRPAVMLLSYAAMRGQQSGRS